MNKLNIHVYTNTDISLLQKRLSKYINFSTTPIDTNIPWEQYGGIYMIPAKSWLDNKTSALYKEHGTNIDGVMILPDRWYNGTRRLYGLQPGFLSSRYELMFVKDRVGWENTAAHEIKHILDNLCRTYLNLRLEDVLGVSDFDNKVVHDEEHWYDFEHELDKVWVHIDQVIRQRRIYQQLKVIGDILNAIQITMNKNRREEQIIEIESNSPLYKASKASIGKDASPRDLVRDGLGCAESLSTLMKTLDSSFPIVTGTWTLWDLFRNRDDFEEVKEEDIERGDIILCVTGTGTNPAAVSNGHVGVISDNEKIMSNDSEDGIWKENYTLEEWKEYYGLRGGYPIKYFRWN